MKREDEDKREDKKRIQRRREEKRREEKRREEKTKTENRRRVDSIGYDKKKIAFLILQFNQLLFQLNKVIIYYDLISFY